MKIPPNFSERIAVVHSISEPLESITVQEICRRNGITRTKFYSLFETKQHILLWYLEFCAEMTLVDIGTELTWEQGVTSFLEVVESEGAFLRASAAVFDSAPKAAFWLLRDKRTRNIEQAIERLGKTSIDSVLRSEIDLYSDLVPQLIRLRMTSGSLFSEEDFTRLWVDCVPRGLHWALDRESER